MKNIRILFAALLISFLTVTSCSKNDISDGVSTENIVGRWYFNGLKEYFQPNGGTKVFVESQPADGNAVIEMKSNGSFIADDETGTYSISGNKLTISSYYDGENHSETYTLKVLTKTDMVIEEIIPNEENEEGVIGTYYYEFSYKKK